jgi:hypothetical protein
VNGGEWLLAAGVAGAVGLLAWVLLVGTWPAPTAKPRGSIRVRPDPQGEARVGRHAMAEDDDTQADSGRHHVGNPEATVSVAALLADALHEGRALRLAWPEHDPDEVPATNAGQEYPTAVLPVARPR